MNKLLFALASLTVLSGLSFAGPVIKVKDKQGREMEVELISLTGERVSFQRRSDGKSFEVALVTFDAESIKAITAKKGELAPAHPTYDLNVVVEKRRKDRGASYYLEEQTVAATVTIKNPVEAQAPSLSVRVVFFGEDRRSRAPSALAVRDYSVKLGAGREDARRLDSFVTIYDSDNKGSGNWGGDQYEGYLLLLLDEKGTIIQHQTTVGKLAEILKRDPDAGIPFKTMKAPIRLDKNYEPSGESFKYYSGSTT